MMKTYNHILSVSTVGTHCEEYIDAVLEWADRLGAQWVEINEDSTVTLLCKSGCICENYEPTNEELQKAMRDARNEARWSELMAEYYR